MKAKSRARYIIAALALAVLIVGAITSLLGAPFFLTIIFSRKEHGQC